MIGIIDMHCHILPDADDGARTIEESKKMLETAYEEGIRTIIATPHYRRDMFECSAAKIREKYEEVKVLAKEIGNDMEILLGCECHAEVELVEKINRGECLAMAETKYVLVEFSGAAEFAYIREQIYELSCNGYKPIIAHVERCKRIKEKHIAELISLGAKMQVNAGSILGDEGFKNKKFCRMMMKKDFISVVGTDAHRSDRREPKIRRCADYIIKKMGSEYAHRVLIENPKKMFIQSKKG